MALTAFPLLSSPSSENHGLRLQATEVQAAHDNGAILIDIRSQEARSSQGVLVGGLAVDNFSLVRRCIPGSEESLRCAKDHHVWWILVSAHGWSSQIAAVRLRENGVSWVSDVVGGYAALSAAQRAHSNTRARHTVRENETVAAHL